jgi:hypothetical protein
LYNKTKRIYFIFLFLYTLIRLFFFRNIDLHLIVDDITTAKALFSLSHCLNIKTVLNPQENLAIFTNHISPMVDHISFFASKA